MSIIFNGTLGDEAIKQPVRLRRFCILLPLLAKASHTEAKGFDEVKDCQGGQIEHITEMIPAA